MPAIALLAPEVWEALKLANIRGVSDEALSRQFEVSREAIRVRRMRDPAWAAAITDARQVKSVNTANVTANVTAEAVSTAITNNLADLHTKTATALVQLAHDKVRKFAENAPDLENYQELATLYKVQRLAAGIDKEGTQVSLNLAMFQQGNAEEGVSWEVEGTEIERDLDSQI
jgi:hypothetical protein